MLNFARQSVALTKRSFGISYLINDGFKLPRIFSVLIFGQILHTLLDDAAECFRHF